MTKIIEYEVCKLTGEGVVLTLSAPDDIPTETMKEFARMLRGAIGAQFHLTFDEENYAVIKDSLYQQIFGKEPD